MTTPEERAQALIDSWHREFPELVLGGRPRAVLAQAIAHGIVVAKGEVWAEVRNDCERILDKAEGPDTQKGQP